MNRVGPYELLEELGRGGFGAVYRARRVDDAGREVAVKVLLSPLADPDERARFEREGRALAAFVHPGIVTIHDAGVSAEGRAYLVLALLTGGSLEERLKEGGRLPSREAAEVARALAGAVAHAHARGVLHRDLKPQNVLFDEEGRPVLTDFGLARLTHWDERLTATGEVLGTPAFMAPEQALGERERIGEASDVYGLGATLYAMLCGRPPFRGGSLLAVLDQVLKAAPPALPSAVDPGLEAICLKCLEKDPAARYPSAIALEEALGAWVAGRVEPGRRRLGGGVAVAVAALFLIVVVGGMWSRTATPPAPAATPEPSERPEPAPTAQQSPPTPSDAFPTGPDGVARALRAARQARAAGDWTRALWLADQAVAREPGGPTFAAQADALWGLERREAALVAMWSAVWVEPRQAAYRLALAKMLAAMRDATGRLFQLRRAWKLEPQRLSQAEREALGRRLVFLGRYDEAVEVLERAIQGRPGDLELRASQSAAWWGLRRVETAKFTLQAVIGRAPAGSARVTYERALSDWLRLEAEARRRRPEPGGKVIALCREATRHMQAKRWGAAMAVLERAAGVRRAPTVLRLMAQTAQKQGRVPLAFECASEALRYSLTPQEGGASAWILATVHAQRGEGSQLLKLLNQAIVLDPRPAEAREQRGLLLFMAGFEEEAFEDFRAALRADPRRLGAQLGRGWERVRLGRYREALSDFEAAGTRVSPGLQAIAQEGRAAALMGMKRFERARSLLRRLGSSSYRARFVLARLHWAQGRRDEAMAEQRAGLGELEVTRPLWAAETIRLQGWEKARKDGPR